MEAAPVADKRELVPNRFTVLEPPATAPPITLEAIDLVLAPALAVDLSGNRLGFGQGYYDRFLAHYTGSVAAVVFAWQVVKAVPHAAHDRRMNFVLHEKGWSGVV